MRLRRRKHWPPPVRVLVTCSVAGSAVWVFIDLFVFRSPVAALAQVCLLLLAAGVPLLAITRRG